MVESDTSGEVKTGLPVIFVTVFLPKSTLGGTGRFMKLSFTLISVMFGGTTGGAAICVYLIKMRFSSVVVTFVLVVVTFSSVVITFASVVITFVPVVITFVSVVITFVPVVITFVSVVITFVSVVITFVPVVITFVSVVVVFVLNRNCLYFNSIGYFLYLCLLLHETLFPRSKERN